MISVIVPVYNVEKYIARCLQSVKAQTFPDYECLVINDGTKDSSMAVAREVIGKDPHFRIIEKENGGYGSVQERGIAESRGDFLMICDSDDWLSPECLEKAYNEQKRTDADIVISGRYEVTADGTTSYDPMFPEEFQEARIYRSSDLLLAGEIVPAPHGKLFRKELLKDLRFAHRVSYTDCELYLLALAQAKTVSYIPDPLAYYLKEREGNSMSADIRKFITQHITVFEHMLEQAEKMEVNDSFYFTVFENSKVLFYELGNSALPKEETKKLGEDFYRIFRRLLPHRRRIVPLLDRYSREGKVAVAKDKLLLQPLFSKKIYDRWLRKLMRERYES